MKIGIDARELEHDMTGIGRYLGEFVKYISKTHFECYMYFQSRPQADIKRANVHVRKLAGPPYIWDHVLLPQALAKDRIDLFFSPYYKKPWSLKCSSIITVHDLNILFDRSYSLPRRLYFKNMIRRALSSSDLILTVSRYVKQEIMKVFHVAEDKIVVNYNVIDERFKPLTNYDKVKAALRRYGIDSEYILYVGNLLPSKNVSSILKAYAQLPQDLKSTYKLVIAGDKHWSYGQLVNLAGQLGLKNNVIFTGFIDENDLVQVYNGSRLFVFPSYREGFGFPPLEAMSCGIPVIASNTTSLPEVLGQAALLIDPFDTQALTKAMFEALSNDGLRNSLIEKGLLRVKEFSGENRVRRLLEIFGRFEKQYFSH